MFNFLRQTLKDKVDLLPAPTRYWSMSSKITFKVLFLNIVSSNIFLPIFKYEITGINELSCLNAVTNTLIKGETTCVD